MENRILIGSKEDTKLFFKELKSSQFRTWKEFWEYFKMRRGDLWNYYLQMLTIPQTRFQKLLELLPIDRQDYFMQKVEVRPWNWGEKLGGQITYSKHPDQINNARIIAIEKNKLKAMMRFDYNQPLTEDLCEFLGALAGDGCACKHGNHYKINFAGDSRYDRHYYDTKINPIAEKLFNIDKPGIFVRENCMWVNFHSKLLYKLVTQRFGIPAGVKFDKVLIPSEILNAEPKMKAAFVRGVFDTDGCVFFDKRPIYKEPYMRLDLTMCNRPILDQIQSCLTELGVPAECLANNKHLHITSKQNVRKYLEIVGSSNRRHISKVLRMYSDFEAWNPASLN